MKAAIQIEGLKFRWRERFDLVLDIDQLNIEEKESVFIKGPSGSGKSTLLNLVGGVLDPNSGSLKVLGQDFMRMSSRQKDQNRGDHMGFIFQQFNLVPYLTVLENIVLPVEISQLRRRRLTEKGLTPQEEAKRLLSHLRLRVDDIIGKPVTELSVGQQQKVAVARALIAGPEIVIADEPTSSLDADARESFIKILFSECKSVGSTLIFVSHDASLGKQFDRQIDLVLLNKAYRAEVA